MNCTRRLGRPSSHLVQEDFDLSGNRHAEDRPNAETIAHLSWRAARPVEPLREIAQLDFVFNANVRDRHPDDIESMGDASDPFVAPNGGETSGDRLIQCGGCDLDGVRNTVHVLNCYAA